MSSLLGWLQRLFLKLQELMQISLDTQKDVRLTRQDICKLQKSTAELVDISKQLRDNQVHLEKVFNDLSILVAGTVGDVKKFDQEVVDALADLKHILVGEGTPSLLVLTYTVNGEKLNMPLQITDQQAFVATPSEKDPLGNPISVDPTQMSYGVSDPSAFDTQANNTADAVAAPDGSSIPAGGFWAKAKQEAGHLGDFQVTASDAKNSLNSQDTVTVVAAGATSLSMDLAVASGAAAATA